MATVLEVEKPCSRPDKLIELVHVNDQKRQFYGEKMTDRRLALLPLASGGAAAR